jgi:monoamine oxidase
LGREEAWAFKYVVKTELSDDLAADPEELSASYASEDVMQRNDALVLGGYDQVIKKLAEGLDIRLNTIVDKIQYDVSAVRVEAGGQTFKGRRVLCTLPLGVLKAGAVKFDPDLPQHKRDAIQNLGMGAFSVIHLRFSEVFWDNVEFIGSIPRDMNETVTLVNRHFYTGAPVLTVLNSGSGARRWDAMADHEAVGEIMRVLRRIYGEKAQEPVSWKRWSWSLDPHALGAYSYGAAGSSAQDRKILAEPLLNRLFFAGEATFGGAVNRNWKMPTVQGAYLSGLRESKNIDKSLREDRALPKSFLFSWPKKN